MTDKKVEAIVNFCNKHINDLEVVNRTLQGLQKEMDILRLGSGLSEVEKKMDELAEEIELISDLLATIGPRAELEDQAQDTLKKIGGKLLVPLKEIK